MMMRAQLFTLGAFASSAAAFECSDLSGVWRHATVNPSRQYIAGVSQGQLHRYRVAATSANKSGEYSVSCESGACKGQSYTLDANFNGTVRRISPTASVGGAQLKCASLAGVSWCLGSGCGEKYRLDEGAPMSNGDVPVNVTCLKGPGSLCTSWQSASGRFEAKTQKLHVDFNSGGGQTGTVSATCDRVFWCPSDHAAGCNNFWCERGSCSNPGPPAAPPPPAQGVLSLKDHCNAIFWYDDKGTNGGTGGGDAWYREVASPPKGPITVHIVPHSHLDPGWLFTVEDMYRGTGGFSNSNDKGPNSPAASKGIGALITEMVAGVAGGPNRTFAPEIAVFYDMWWKDANASQRATVRRLVQEGRLEWTGGGWTQHDEAASRVEDQVDQLTLGHLWLRSVVGSGPVTSAWQPDPFGHSSTAAYIFRMSGKRRLSLLLPLFSFVCLLDC